MQVEDLAFLPVRQLSERLRAGRVSSVELTELYLERLERIGPELGALVTLLRESALAEAREADREIRAGRARGPLHGIPYGAKDLLALRGHPTTWGAVPYREQVFDFDATAIRRLRDAGAVLVAKLAMVEIAGGMGYDEANASFTGPGRSPWNRDFWSGGSSSGSGAAVAAGLVPFAIGSETWGSIVTPAAFSGVSGLRPTYGRVSRYGAMALSWTMDKLGPMCRSADDCGLVLEAIAGQDPLDPSTVERSYSYAAASGGPPERQRPRIGVPRDATEGVQPAVAENFERALEVLASEATVVRDVQLPDYPYASVAGVIIDAEAASIFEDLLLSGKVQQLTAPGSRTGALSGLVLPAVDYLRAMRLRTPIQQELDELLQQYDALATPTRATVAYPIEVKFREAYPEFRGGTAISAAGNVAGLPGLALPNGFGESGLPTSFTLTGRAWEENRLLALGRAYQSRTDWHQRRPPVS